MGYCIFAIVYFKAPSTHACNSVAVCIQDSAENHYIDQAMVHQFLAKKGIQPIGQHISPQDAYTIEKTIQQMSPIKDVECYMGYDSCLYIDIWQRHPVFRVIANNGRNYYIDQDRRTMPLSDLFTPYLPLVTGHVTTQMAQNELFDFIQYLFNDPDWKVLIAEVHVNSKQQITLTSKQGIPYIEIGKLNNYAAKMEKLRAWYQQHPNKNDSNIYQKITIHYENLLFCTKSNNHE